MNFDLQIEEKQKEKQKIINQMEVKKELFLEELTNFTFNWFEEQTLSTIKTNSEKVVELGEDKARELKGKIKELKEKSGELVQKHMKQDDIWWHTNENKISYYPEKHRLLNEHEQHIKLMFGELGKILIEYGLVTADSEHNRNHSSCWSYVGYNSNRKLKYGYGLSYSSELYDINYEYTKLIKEVQAINEQIGKLEEQKKKENVEEWWQSL